MRGCLGESGLLWHQKISFHSEVQCYNGTNGTNVCDRQERYKTVQYQSTTYALCFRNYALVCIVIALHKAYFYIILLCADIQTSSGIVCESFAGGSQETSPRLWLRVTPGNGLLDQLSTLWQCVSFTLIAGFLLQWSYYVPKATASIIFFCCK